MFTNDNKSIKIETTDFGVLIRLFKELLDRGLRFRKNHIDLEDKNSQPIIPITNQSLVAVRFKLNNNYALLTEATFYKNSRHIKIIAFLDKLRIKYNTQSERQPDLDTCSKFSTIQQNTREIVDLIEKITIGKICNKKLDSEFLDIKNTYSISDQIFERTISIVKILNYKEYINTLYNVDLEDQYRFYNFLKKNIESNITYKFKDFTLYRSSDILDIRFLGMPIAAMNFRRNSLENYFRYFRHRGMSFFVNYLKRASQFDEFEKYIHAKSLKSQIM